MKFHIDDALCGFDVAIRLLGFDEALGNTVPPQLYLVQGKSQFGCSAFLEKS
jgi:hypothetical protein